MGNENEIWKDIPDYEGLYQASSEGRIRSLDREVRHPSGGVRIANGKVLKPAMNIKGYLQVGLSKDDKRKMFLVHRLVWITFNGTIPESMQVNHIDENKANNRLENLNLMTPIQNVNWGTRNERAGKAVAKANTNNPLTSKSVVALDANNKIVFGFKSAREAGRNGFHQGHLSACCRGEQRAHRGYRWRYKEET